MTPERYQSGRAHDSAASHRPAKRIEMILFHEYFHGDSGAGLGASHQTGWTALVASMMQQAAHAR
jgi:hypothetical protein